MKTFVTQLFGVMLLALIVGSVQSATADHDAETGQGIYKDERSVTVVPTEDSDYQIYLQTILRNGDGHLISVTERMGGFVIPHKITDHVFDTLMGEKEIVTIDNLKYEKAQYTFNPTLVQRTEKIYPIFEEIPIEYELDEDAHEQMKEDIRDYYRWKIHHCATVEGHGYTCISVFQGFNVVRLVTPADTITNQWTILRALN